MTCEETYLGPCGPLELSCSTEGEVDTVSCIFNNGSPEDCKCNPMIQNRYIFYQIHYEKTVHLVGS